ncbi:MAG: hypothetical protein J2P46_04660 [Zavarzinella sp.]|nr:hypothetical protein [Zavarzinella sp.]
MTKTEAELHRLGEAIAGLNERTASLDAKIQRGFKDVEKLEATLDKLRDQLAAQQTQIAVLQANFADLTKRWDESDRRRWTVYGVMLAAALTFVANPVLLFLKR